MHGPAQRLLPTRTTMTQHEETRHGRWLMRQIGPEKTLVFVLCVQIEKNDAEGSEGYVSTLLPLEEGTVTAAGATPDEAEDNALTLFKDMIDHCIDSGLELTEVIGDSGAMDEVDVPVAALLSALDSLAKRQQGHEGKKPPRRAGARPWLEGLQAACAE